MKLKFKSNKIVLLLLIILCCIFVFNPKTYSQSCLNAISVWAFSVLPVLLPMFIITKIIINLVEIKQSKMDKLFNKLYNTPSGSSIVFFLSLLAGYPVGAKLISELYSKNYITSNQSKKMLSFCSICGPMFILGTIGSVFLKSTLAGLIIFISNVLGALFNGFLYRGKKEILQPQIIKYEKPSNILEDSVYNSLISILMVGTYIAISFIIIDLFKNLGIINLISKCICSVFNINKHQYVVNSVLCGIIEMTNGLLDLSKANVGLNLKIILSSLLTGFGGISVFLQSFSFMSKLKIKPKIILLQKLTQGFLTIIFASILCLIFL